MVESSAKRTVQTGERTDVRSLINTEKGWTKDRTLRHTRRNALGRGKRPCNVGDLWRQGEDD